MATSSQLAIQVTTLDRLVAQMGREKVSPAPLLVAAAPAAAVVERMGLGTSDVQAGNDTLACCKSYFARSYLLAYAQTQQ